LIKRCISGILDLLERLILHKEQGNRNHNDRKYEILEYRLPKVILKIKAHHPSLQKNNWSTIPAASLKLKPTDIWTVAKFSKILLFRGEFAFYSVSKLYHIAYALSISRPT